MKSIFQQVFELENQIKAKHALCLLVNTKGSTPRKIGTKMLVDQSGNIVGTIGGGNLEKVVIEAAKLVITKGVAQYFHYDLLNDLGMCFGGEADVYIEPISPKKKLIVFGAGHIGVVLAKFANELDFQVTLVDERNGIFENI